MRPHSTGIVGTDIGRSGGHGGSVCGHMGRLRQALT